MVAAQFADSLYQGTVSARGSPRAYLETRRVILDRQGTLPDEGFRATNFISRTKDSS